jgi:hypothetical protein
MEEVLIRSIAEGGEPTEEIVGRALGLPEKELEDLLDAAGKLKSANAARFLALIYPSLSDKRLQKLVKKALFLLKTQGIHVEEPRPTGESVLRKIETSREARAYLSNYDDRLTRVLLVATEMKKNQFILSHGELHFSDGLTELKSMTLPREGLETLLEDFLRRATSPMVVQPISAPYAGYLVEEAAGLSGKETGEARSINRILAAAEGDVRRPEDIYLLNGGSAPPASLENVLAHPIFEPFLLTWPGIEGDEKKLLEAVNPSIVLPPYLAEERRQAFLEDLAKGERLGPKIAFFKRMLEDYAYLLHCLKEYSLFRGLVDRLKEQASVGKAFLYFIQKSFGRLKEKGERLPGVIVDPYSRKA